MIFEFENVDELNVTHNNITFIKKINGPVLIQRCAQTWTFEIHLCEKTLFDIFDDRPYVICICCHRTVIITCGDDGFKKISLDEFRYKTSNSVHTTSSCFIFGINKIIRLNRNRPIFAGNNATGLIFSGGTCCGPSETFGYRHFHDHKQYVEILTNNYETKFYDKTTRKFLEYIPGNETFIRYHRYDFMLTI